MRLDRLKNAQDGNGERFFCPHIAAQAGVLGLVDHTHSTATELYQDFVVGDGLADHGVSTRRLSSDQTGIS